MSLDLSTTKHHPVLEEIVDVLCNKTENMDRGFFRAEVAYFLSKMAATMWATIDTADRGEIPVNTYVIALATSGYGKGHSIGLMEGKFLEGFKKRFMEDTFPLIAEQNLWVIANHRAGRNNTDQQEEFDKLASRFERMGSYPFTFDSGTVEGVKDLRQKLLMASCGAINFQVDEIGSNLVRSTELLNLYFELYDQGKVNQKLTKSTSDNKREEHFDGKTPTNMLGFGAPTRLLDGGTTEKEFYTFLEAGYARRCLFAYGQKKKIRGNLTPEEAYKKLTEPSNDSTITKWATHFYNLADPATFGWKMVVNASVGVALQAYKMHCEHLSDEMGEHDDIRKSEMSHRYFKALKLAGAYAFVDQSTEIEMDHLNAAIKLVEESGEAFNKILNRESVHVKLAKYIAARGTEVTHPDLYDALPFYKSSQAARNEMMTMAISWGYKNHIIIKKSFVDGIEFFKGETLKETDLNKIILSYSANWAYNYQPESAPFDKLDVLTQHKGMHWANHHFKAGHRAEENVLSGFNMIVLDVDGGTRLETAHELMKDYCFLTYTTKRHTETEHRFRMMLPINYQLDLDQEEYREFMNGIMGWLPFATDESANQRAKKWESFEGGNYHYNLDGELLDVLSFIPKTSRNEQYKKQNQELGSLDNLERWFAGRIASGNRNNQMIKYALTLVDSGWDLPSVRTQVHAFNKKLSDPMSEQEIDSTILVTVAKKYQRVA